MLRRAEGDPGTLSSLVFGAGVAFTAVWSVSAVALATVAYAVGISGAPVSDLDVVRVLPQMGSLLLLLGGGFAGILLLLATSVVIYRTAVLPRWLAGFGILVAIALAFDVTYMNIVPLLAWVAGASIVLFRRQDETAVTPGRQSSAAKASVTA